MAAGFGSRMAPATLTTPKPLIVVNGKRIIDTLLDAVVAAGITEIYIVRGYRAEQFDVLLEKYPMIRFLENPLYDKANNIASGYVARDLYSKAYVLDSDLLLYNPSLIRKYEYRSNYLGVPVEKTDDWCFLAPNGVIEKIQIGGEKVYHWIGLSYWTAEDGARLATDIPEVLKQEGGSKYYWDEVALRVCKDRYRVHVRPIKADDLVEIDTYQELCALDSSYR